ncbi:MAG: YCF48-related protein, partial [Ignavibacteria bacterium]|nr:YCF48-related protein [Ignavibacteria bacterium]
QYSGGPGLFDVQFINQHTGWVIGSGSTILKTTNGGLNWFTQPSNLSAGKNLHGLSMLNANTGYMVGWFETILKTTNGGDNWLVLSDGPVGQGNSWTDASFINTQTGWICGPLGVVKKTTNGGLNWDSLNAGGTLRNIVFVNALTGWVAGDGGYIRRSTDGGLSWQFQFPAAGPDFWTNALHFINPFTGWAIGYEGHIYRTTNAGNNWERLTPTLAICIHFVNQHTGWAGGNMGRMYKSTDGGLNWYQQTIPSLAFSTGFSFINDSVGWATVGGRIIHTSNGGTYVNVEPISNEIPSQFKLYQNYPNPFNSSTVIEFDISEANHYKLTVYDILGREKENIINNYIEPGKYRVRYNASSISGGVYFYILSSDEVTLAKKFTLVK